MKLPKPPEDSRQDRTMLFRYMEIDFVVTYKIDINGITELWGIKTEDELIEVLKTHVLDAADNQIRRHATGAFGAMGVAK